MLYRPLAIQGAHPVPFGEQHFGQVAADGTDSASRAGD
jgi:hypothetical protein